MTNFYLLIQHIFNTLIIIFSVYSDLSKCSIYFILSTGLNVQGFLIKANEILLKKSLLSG